MRTKKMMALLLSLSLLLPTLVGCGAISESMEAATADSSREMYYTMEDVIDDPDSRSYSDLAGKFTFSAKTLSEKFSASIEGTEMNFVNAEISLNIGTDKYFVINVDNIKDYDYPKGTYVSVTGELDGSIYWTEDNKQVEVLNVKASKIEKLVESDKEPVVNSKFSMANQYASGNVTFDSAEFIKEDPGVRDLFYVYFDFENTDEDGELPFYDGLHFFQGDIPLESTLVGSNAPPPQANALEASYPNQTFAGKTNHYYMVLTPISRDLKLDPSKPIKVVQINYDFDIVQTYDIPVTAKNNTTK